jgi:hypothetical protein
VKYLLFYRLGERLYVRLGGEETDIGWLNRVAVPRDAKHPVAGGFCDKGMCTFPSLLRRNYVFDSSIAIMGASDAWIHRSSVRPFV